MRRCPSWLRSSPRAPDPQREVGHGRGLLLPVQVRRRGRPVTLTRLTPDPVRFGHHRKPCSDPRGTDFYQSRQHQQASDFPACRGCLVLKQHGRRIETGAQIALIHYLFSYLGDVARGRNREPSHEFAKLPDVRIHAVAHTRTRPPAGDPSVPGSAGRPTGGSTRRPMGARPRGQSVLQFVY